MVLTRSKIVASSLITPYMDKSSGALKPSYEGTKRISKETLVGL